MTTSVVKQASVIPQQDYLGFTQKCDIKCLIFKHLPGMNADWSLRGAHLNSINTPMSKNIFFGSCC